MASQFANGKRRKRDRDGRRRTARSLPSIIFYRASTYRQPRTHDRVHAHARATRIINHYYLGVIFLRYNFVCLPPRVGARGLCTPRTRGGSFRRVAPCSSLLLLDFFFIVSTLCPPSASSPPFSSSSPFLLPPSTSSRFVNSRHRLLCVHTPAASLASNSTCFPHR